MRYKLVISFEENEFQKVYKIRHEHERDVLKTFWSELLTAETIKNKEHIPKGETALMNSLKNIIFGYNISFCACGIHIVTNLRPKDSIQSVN